MSPAPPDPAADQPIDDFSSCHVQILAHLQALGDLPALLAPAAQARRLASEALAYFGDAIREHHAEEERDLFPAALFSARKGVEHDQLQGMVERLTREHRAVEQAWGQIEPQLRLIAKGQAADLALDALQRLLVDYQRHALFEESQFLPLCRTILGRNGDHMAALGMSLHLRRALPAVLDRVGYRI